MIRTPLMAAAAVALSAGAAQAVVTVHNTEAAFNAAAGATILEDFNSIQAEFSLFSGVMTPAGSLIIEHTGSDGNTFVSNGTGSNNIDGTFHLDPFVAPENPAFGFSAEVFRIHFPEPVTGAAFDYADFFSIGSSLGANVFAGTEFAFNTLDEGLAGTNGTVPPTFIGFTSDTPFSFIEFSADAGFGEAFGLDNVRYTPTPGSLALLAIAGVAARRRR